MMYYSVRRRDGIAVKGYGFLSFARNMGKKISKKFSGKYNQKSFDHAKKTATDALKTALKIAEARFDWQ